MRAATHPPRHVTSVTSSAKVAAMSEETGTDQSQETEEAEEAEETGAQAEVSEPDAEEIEAERQERLDPENRPRNAEVDNTQRDFDEENGEFLDDSDESDLTDEERAVTADG
ncbi:hypothetical protein ENKNEFLB_01221 [Nocardioides aquaticus]|uniref:Uncharacterized protein n=2 Tax=Nocardioides aquaticus TaxID=160826 RepID=A0ABX8EJP1_9ACTN|nr:hypothetical protein ENKNEFLB_01221 [Nocardioides aquaticus]